MRKKKGGAVGTSGNFSTLESNISALVNSLVATIVDGATLITEIIELPSNMGVEYKNKGAPGADI